MLTKLVKNAGIIDGKGRKVLFTYGHFMDACKIIAEDIKDNYDLENERIGLLGLARGGLPMLVTLSHLLDQRDISMMQVKMSSSDPKKDYGDPDIINKAIADFDKFIVLEDIIYRGKSIMKALDHMKKINKEVVGIYSLVVDEKYKNSDKSKIEMKYVYEVNEQDWLYFFWEEDIRGLK